MAKHASFVVTAIVFLGISLIGPSLAGQTQSYTVKAGDSLMTISNKFYGTHQKWQQIQEANPSVDPGDLKIGTKLLVPNANRKALVKKAQVSRPASIGAWIRKARNTIDNSDNKQKAVSRASIKKKMLTTRRVPASLPQKKLQVLEGGMQFRVKDVAQKPSSGYAQSSYSKSASQQFSNPKLAIENAHHQKLASENRVLKKQVEMFRPKHDLLAREKASSDKMLARLERKNLELQADLQDLKERLIRKVDDTTRVSELKREVKKLRRRLVRYEGSKDPQFVKQLQSRAVLAESESQVLKEKHRILSQRYWLAKNENPGRCEISVAQGEEFKRESFRKLIRSLNQELGPDYVFVEPNSNSVLFQMSGRAVYGVDKPKVRTGYYRTMTRISEWLEKLPVESIQISGFTKYRQVTSDKGRKVSGSQFMLTQALTLQDYWVDQLGWSAQKVVASTVAKGSNAFPKNSNKLFEISVRFEPIPGPQRGIAAIKTDQALSNLGGDILSHLHEPKYGRVKIKEDGLEIHLARSYFFAGAKKELSPQGKQRLDTILDMFALVDDAVFQVKWVPGVLEQDEAENRQSGLAGLEAIRAHIVKEIGIPSKLLQVMYVPRQNKLRDAFVPSQDHINRRVIIKMVPKSTATRPLGHHE